MNRAPRAVAPPIAETPPPEDTRAARDPDADPGAPPTVSAVPSDATVTASGLAYKLLTRGPNPTARPGPQDVVEVHYTGWTTDGKQFDSSKDRGKAAKFGLDGVIPGWAEGMQLVEVGATARLWVPEKLAYGGRGGTPRGMLVFDVELVSVTRAPRTPPRRRRPANHGAQNQARCALHPTHSW